MKQLDQWLNANFGMATRLAKALSVSVSHVSQVRSGKRRVPADWMPTIEAMSGGLLTVESMVMHQAKPRLAARRERRKVKS